MKNLLLNLLLTLTAFFVSCGESRDDQQIDEQDTPAADVIEKDRPVTYFPLDSLLHFSSETELKDAFGENVKRSVGYMPEGMGEYKNTLLFPGSSNEVEFVWRDDSVSYSGLKYIRIAGQSTDWKTKEGITIGTTLKKLEELNKKPFTFYGFQWDYSGTTLWDGGYLDQRNISVKLTYPDTVIPDRHRALVGDHKIKSDSEPARSANPVVREVILRKKDDQSLK